MPVSAQPGAVKPGLNQHVDHPVVGGGGGEGREPGGVCALATVPRLQPPNSGCVRLSRRLPGPRCISCQQVCSRHCRPRSSHPDRSLDSTVRYNKSQDTYNIQLCTLSAVCHAADPALLHPLPAAVRTPVGRPRGRALPPSHLYTACEATSKLCLDGPQTPSSIFTHNTSYGQTDLCTIAAGG